MWFRAAGDQRLITLLEAALEAQPVEGSALRARVLARLAGALRDDPVPERRAALTREALAIAREVGDRATLAYALEGSYAALSVPQEIETWVDTVEEMSRVAEEAGDREQLFFGRVHALGAAMVLGDMRAVAAELRTLSALADELRQPAQHWAVAIGRGMFAAFAGRNDEADRVLEQTAEIGAAGQGLDATFYFVVNLQRWAVRRAQGRLGEVEESVASFLEEFPNWPLLRSVLASALCERGRLELALRELDVLAADDFASLHLGSEWFFSASLLAEVCGVLGDTDRAARLYEMLAPYGGYNVISHPEVALGSASRYLGILATTLSRWDDAERHLEAAAEMNRRMGARPWVAHTQADHARMLRRRSRAGDAERADGLAREAQRTYRELGMESWAERLRRE